MSTEDLVVELGAALSRFGWKRVDELCAELVGAVREMADPPPPYVRKVLSSLRRKRRFGCTVRLAEALLNSGDGSTFVHRQYAQALIDLGMLAAAERVLQDAVAQDSENTEAFELQGLLGRVYKQWYVARPALAESRRRETLQRAIDAYVKAYTAAPEQNYWHGVNVVALLERGRRDNVDVTAGRPSAEIAASILAALEAADRDRTDPAPAWEVATKFEVQLALANTDAMLARLREYVAHRDADAFEVASTLRQVEEVWNLSENTPPGSAVIPLLRAKLLQEEGAGLTFDAKEIVAEQQRTARLELVHGFDRFQTLQWYRQGLECCGAVARIETETGRGVGTGWLLRGGDWVESLGDAPVLVTNAHVVSPSVRPFPGALQARDVIANFQVAGGKTRLGDIVWSSPVEQLDCTVLHVKNAPASPPLRLAAEAVTYTVPPPRLYIIGHPGGRDLEFSLQDNLLLGCNDRLLHYRTPTEGGSSGSPVFDDAWRVVGLHHAGDGKLVRLDGQPGTYEANEGITIAALLREANTTTAPTG